MAKDDVRIEDVGGHNTTPTYKWQTESGATDINFGEPVKMKSAGSQYVIPLADGDPVEDTDFVVGIAASDSTHTSSADGTIEVYMPLPGMLYRCSAATAANLADSVRGDRVTFDLGSSTYTVDEDEGDAADHGLVIVDVDTDNDDVIFAIRDRVTIFNY